MQDSNVDRNAVEILAEEFVDRYRRGERPLLSEYTTRFPDLAEEIRDLFPAMLMMENLKPADEIASAAARTAPLELRQLGDYRIIREVGRGGMGVVYEAEQVSLGRHVALKVLPREMVANPNQRMRFEREAKAAAKLHHSNIVPVFGIGDDDGELYYVMQFIQGLALDDVLDELKRLRGTAIGDTNVPSTQIKRAGGHHRSVEILANSLLNGSLEQLAGPEVLGEVTIAGADLQLPAVDSALAPHSSQSISIGNCSEKSGLSNSSVTLPKRSSDSGANASRQTTYSESIAQIGVQVARALDYAHSQGILHRDIKPANLVLDLKGTVWVTDFGLAKLDDDRGLTQAGDILGTLRYMSPESFKGRFDRRSEVYSLGLTLYEMLAYRPAFNASSRNALIDQVMQSQVERLVRLNPEVPTDLQTIIHKAIDRDSEHRYQSAGELAEDLQRFLNDEPIKARRVSMAERLNRWSRHNKSLAASLAAVLLLVSFLAIGSMIAAGYFRSVSGTLKETVTDLEQAQRNLSEKITTLKLTTERLTASESEAVKQTNVAQKHSNAAEAARRESLTVLADMQTERGLMAAAEGDHATAMLWFAHASKQTRHDPARQAANRLRARNAMEESALPLALLSHAKRGEPSRLIFQPHGDLLMSAKRDSLQIWNWQLERSISWADELKGVNDASWSPDGLQVAVGFATGEVQIRSIPAGRIVHSWTLSEAIESLAWSRDGTRLAVACQTVQVWNVSETPVLQHRCSHPDKVHSLRFNRDGTRLATACRDRLARVFDIGGHEQELSPRFTPVPHAPRLDDGPVFIDGDRAILTISDDTGLGWWNVETGAAEKPAGSLPANYGRRLAVSPDGSWFGVAADPPVVWNISGQHFSMPYTNHVRGIAFGPDGMQVATACQDWMTRIWPVPNSDGRQMVIPQLEGVSLCSFSDGGSYVAACGDEKIRVWKQPTPWQNPFPTAAWKHVIFQPRPSFDGRFVTPGRWHETPTAYGPVDSLTVVQMADARPAGPEIFINQIVDSCVCGDSQTVAIVALHSNTGKLSIVDIKSGRDLIQPMTLPGPACSVATRSGTTDVAVLCQSGQILVVNQKNGTIRINIATPAWNGDARHSRLRYSSDGQRLIHLTVQSEIAVYDATSGQPCFPNISPLLSDSICRALAISADNRWLATGVNGRNAVQVWDLSTGKAVSEPLLHPGDLYGIFSIAFSPDGRWVLSGNKDGRARLWDWRTGKLVCPPLQHSDEVQSVAFTRDGQYALTGLRHGTLRVWELTTGKLIAPPIRYPLPERGSTGTMAVIGDQVIVSGLDFPIIDLSPLLKPPALSTDSMQLLAQLATGRRLELGELSSLSPAEWHDLWSESSARSMTIEQLANSVTRQVDRAVNIASRFLNVAKESKSEIVLVKPTPPRESAPEMPIVPDKNKQNDELTVSAKRQAILLLEQQIAARPDAGALAEELANLLLANRTSRWHPLEFSTVKSRDGAAFTRRNDGAFVVAQANSPEDIYKLNTVNGGQKVAAIRLDVLTDTSLPSQGPGRHPSGNFHLSAFRLVRPSIGEGQSDQGVPLSAAYSSYAYDAPDVDILGTIHANSKLVWHVWGKTSSSNHAVFVLDKPIIVNPQNPLIIELHHRAVGAAMNLGCFRLSASDDARAFDRDFDFQNIQSKVYSGAIALASAYTLIDQDANAIPLLEQATNLNSEYSAGIRLLLLSECHSRLNHTAESRKYYDELLVWLRLNRLPRSFQTRVTALMQAIGFLTAQQAKSNYQRLEIEHEQRNLTERIQRDPNSALLYFQRAELFARLGQWREAAADHVRMTEITPGDCLVWLRSAATLLMADDRDGHKALCQRLVSQFPKPAEPLIADCVCKSSLIVPDVIPMSDLPTAILIESINVNGEYAGWFTCNCALMSLREGNFTRSLELSQRFGNSPTGPSGALILTIRSLAQHHLQQTEAALQSLQQAESLIPVALRTLGTEKHTGPTAVDAYTVSHDWLVAELLRREAASVSRPAAK